MNARPLYISEEQVKKLLCWDTLIPVIENAMGRVSDSSVIQPARLKMRIPSQNGFLLTMPACDESQEVLACKVVTAYPDNVKRNLPSVLGTILLMNSQTGQLKSIMEGTEITTWRTAAASIVATKHLHKGEKKILAILGTGIQGRIHAIGMMHCFKFKEVRIWSRTLEKTKKLCKELGPMCTAYESNEDCVRGADVIVTATNATNPIVALNWVKDGAHVNAIGAGSKSHHDELEEEIYKDTETAVYVDSMASAQNELKKLLEIGVPMTEIGDVISKKNVVPLLHKRTVFQSLGMAIEDAVAAKLIYDLAQKDQSTEAILKK